MSSPADYSVRGGLELPGPTAITHATDQQKNRNGKERRRRRKKRPSLPEPEAEAPVDENDPAAEPADGADEAEDQDKPTIDYLA